jgi:coenzyme F420-reducing hydrogenase beta subunit
MRLDDSGRMQATVDHASIHPDHDSAVLAVCPFSGRGPNEDALARELFGAAGRHDDRIGYHLATYAGYVAEEDFRASGSSGGIASWLLTELLREDVVDTVIHVAPRVPTEDDSRIFEFRLSETPTAVRAGAKSRYYPTEMSGVLRTVRERPGRYALAGTPCFIKAARLLARQDAVIAGRIRVGVALVCGHLKTAAFAEMMAWQCGVRPGSLTAFDFRKKRPGVDALSYMVESAGDAQGRPVRVSEPVAGLFGTDWGYGFFKYSACDYCDDVVGETADVSVGDAWIDPYVKDSSGTNIVIVRSPIVQRLVDRAQLKGRLHLEPLDVERLVRSQQSAFYHRRDGLAYRLWLDDRAGRWRPPKRVLPRADHLGPMSRKVFRLRVEMAARSHSAFAAARASGDFQLFVRAMTPLIRTYEVVARLRWRDIRERLRRRLGLHLPRSASS